LLCGGQFFGFLLGLILSFYIDGNSKLRSNVGGAIYIFLMLLGTTILFKLKEDLRKLKYE
jgi:hypothetical protein